MGISGLLEKSTITGCSKTPGSKAREGSRNEAYWGVRRSDGSRVERSRRVFFNSLISAFGFCFVMINRLMSRDTAGPAPPQVSSSVLLYIRFLGYILPAEELITVDRGAG
jgi:hypothetical protein